MINLEKCKDEFIKYTEQFDLEEIKLKRKQLHSLRVMQISNMIARSLDLTEEEIQIATLIGLLHDVGRFAQYKKYKTFQDSKSIDHADLGVEILQENDYIKKFLQDEIWIDTILIAIKNHNKYKIEKGLNKKKEIFCKIIRDADKADIMFEGANIFWNNPSEIREIETAKLNSLLYQTVKKHKMIERKKLDKESGLDSMIIMLCFVFDLNFRKTFQIIEEQKSIDTIFNKFKFEDDQTKKYVTEIQNTITQYIKENEG